MTPAGRHAAREIVRAMRESVELDEGKMKELDMLLKSYNSLKGRVAHFYPKKGEISVDGRTMKYKDAVEKMERILDESVDELDEYNT